MISNELNTIVTQIKQQGNMSFLAGATENQIEEFEGVIVDCYNCVFVIDTDKVKRSFSYSDVFIGVLELNI